MASRRARPAPLVALLCTLALLGAACTSSDQADEKPDEPTDQSSGGPTTTTPGTGEDPDEGASPVQDGIRIEVLSSQPDRVTGPDARIRVIPAKDQAAADVTVMLGDQDVTDQLTEVDGHLEGVVVGLVEGNNALVASAGGSSITQRIRSWPLAGPMISGPHGPLLACSTAEHGLGEPSDDDCSAPTKVTWRYVDRAGALKDLPDPAVRPDDVGTTEVDGEEVPFVVRYEQGVVNRSVYELASLDPSPGGADSSQADAAWNRRLIYRFGSGCATSYGQGTASLAATALDPTYLARGYALATATFNTGAVQCNDVVSAETTMMVKERFVEQFGVPDFTIGEGASGGAAQIHLIAQNYPSLLDGAVALDPLPDTITVASGIADCGLLNAYYRTPEGRSLTPAQRTAVNGHATTVTCDRWERDYGGLVDPTTGCDPKIAPERIWDADTNPGGVRCTYQDGSVNQFGTDRDSPYAARTLDNVGIQYGLDAVNAGTLPVDDFIALNAGIGGYDPDGQLVPDRMAADPVAVQTAYENGRVSTGVGDQQKIPIIDVSLYDDDEGAIADHVRAFSLRERLTFGAPAEAAPGFRIWTRDAAETSAAEAGAEAMVTLDAWLTTLEEDREGGDRETALTRTRPDDAGDNCLPPGADEPERGEEPYGEDGACTEAFPTHGTPRIAAGGFRSDDVLKCQLKAVDPLDYGVELTQAQFDELLEVFPEGVCDWAAAGVGQTTPSMSDRTYEDAETPAELA